MKIAKQEKPVFLELSKIRFPITAIASILHRISGFVVFLLIPLLLWMAHSASTAAGFAQLQDVFQSVVFKFFVWVVLSALLYHLLAGIKHLLMDTHIMSEDLTAAKAASKLTIILAVILIVLAGVWLW